MNSIRNALGFLSVTPLQRTVSRGYSVFMKPQKKMDPEIAKIREMRRRRRLEREIREIKKHAKKPKPVEEMTIDVISAKNLKERYRPPADVSEEVEDTRAVAYKKYIASRGQMDAAEMRWLRNAVMRQERALDTLKALNPKLYEAAVQADDDALDAAIEFSGQPLTPPLEDYTCPDGEYVDTTRTWM